MSVHLLDSDALRQLVKTQRGVIRTYARLTLAWRGGKGVLLSPDEIHELLTRDRAIGDALTTAIEELDDAGMPGCRHDALWATRPEEAP